MRKTLLLIGIFILQITYTLKAQDNLYKVANISGIKLREVPAANGQYVVFIAENESVLLLSKLQGDWCKVKYNGKVGFTLFEYLKKAEVKPAVKTDTTNVPAVNEDPKKAKEAKHRKNKKKQQ
ncbi:hypothetical protein MYP_3428 [Sporocytophaga myxococcoides]|uniref:SH3b domain-containing protein n=1 Tax=Sporocytophaga myxococcoides TaxID=153721 RepID=A0A098LI92_9BACT|nr:SH3 domain-containing protein [Sporocytophaga myxococcoides]GAL86199.1 hypothetical protein MYP_3428 [Sporocytophaga myxococcoides]